MRLSVPLHRNMGPAVLDRLGKLAPLPAKGIVAGQAVASAVEDLFGRGGGVYNDVDVFTVVPGRMRLQADKVAAPAERYVATVALRPQGNDEYDHLKLQPSLVSSPTYVIEGVNRRGLLNLVYYRGLGGMLHPVQRILAGFDLNCVRVGIDLSTRELVWDRHYQQFIETSELRIVAVHTPLHSFLRLLRKKNELPDVHADVETSAAISWQLQDKPVAKLLRERNAASYWFGRKYRELAAELAGELNPYFELQERWVRAGKDGAVVTMPDAGDETFSGVLLGTLSARGKPSVLPLADLETQNEALCSFFPERTYRARAAYRSTGIPVPTLPWHAEAAGKGELAPYAQAYGPGYFEGLVGVREARELGKRLATAPSLLMTGLPAAEQAAALQTVERAALDTGVPDVAHVQALTLGSIRATSPEEVVAAANLVVQREREQSLYTLPFELELDEAVWRPVTTEPLASLTLLRNRRELYEFSHRAGWDDVWLKAMTVGVCFGVSLGRHARDQSVLQFNVDTSTGLLGWTFRVHKRALMRQAHEAQHLALILALFEHFQQRGWVTPFVSGIR